MKENVVDHGSDEFKRIAEESTILRTLVGSGVHGLSIADTDDRDEMGVCVEPKNYVVGLDTFEQYIHRTAEDRTGIKDTRSGPGDLDLTIYSLRKWMRLALNGNPTVLTPLFTPMEHVVSINVLGEALRAGKSFILSRQAGYRFLGYLNGQRERMVNGTVGKRVNRPELIEKYGFDTKFAGHAVRLGVQGVELLETGDLALPMTEPWRSWIVDLRQGKHTLQEAITTITFLEERLKTLVTTSDLPEYPDRVKANEFLAAAYDYVWNGGT